jgi:2,5-diketo-D-gluconate reductase B
VNTGTIPAIGFGVYALDPPTTERAVSEALSAGYRHIDTAQSYGNEVACGAAVRATGIARDEVFITTKVTPRNFAANTLVPSIRESGDHLGVDVIDMALIHYPSPWDEIPMEVYISQLGEAQEMGIVRLIGVSNFTRAQMDRAAEILGPGRLATNQIEIHVFHQNRKVVDHCRAMGIPATAYCALARGMLFGVAEAKLGPHPSLLSIARKHGASVAQIGLAFLLAEGHVTLCTATDPTQIKENFAASNVELAADDMAELRKLDMEKRMVDMPYFPIFD